MKLPKFSKHEVTLCIIKPDVSPDLHDDILKHLQYAGLELLKRKWFQFDPMEAERFYYIHHAQPFFQKHIEFMASKPCKLLVFEHPNAVALLRNLIGSTDPKQAAPCTIRHTYGTDLPRNAVHASDSPENALREISFLFPWKEFPSCRLD